MTTETSASSQLSGRLAELEQAIAPPETGERSRVFSVGLKAASQRGRDMLRALYPRSGRARTIGLTGAPGAGKSTVTNELAKGISL